MVQAVDTLIEDSRLSREKLDELSITVVSIKTKVDAFSVEEGKAHTRISNIEGTLNRGKGLLGGLLIAAGAVGSFVHEIATSIWHKIFT
jgi:hypothetical protein